MNCVYMASCDDAPEHHLLNIMESPFQCLDEFDVCVVRHVMIYLNSLWNTMVSPHLMSDEFDASVVSHRDSAVAL